MKLLFKNIIDKAINENVSDVHFIPDQNKVHIKFRKKEYLSTIETVEVHIYRKLLTYMKYQAGLDVSTHSTAQSGRYAYKLKQLYYLRVSTLPLSLGFESCVVRIIPQYFQNSAKALSINQLFKLVHKKQGLILFSGPTGSGKSTLMYQLIVHAKEHLNVNIITVEDPVERLVEGITQVSINEKAGINYANSFKAILRCDPDIILIGEIRDAMIAKQVIHASLSGHLVLSTIHSNNCKGALSRLLEMGITIQELRQTVLSIINQRLVITSKNESSLIYEQLNREDIAFYFENQLTLPNTFKNLSYKLQEMAKEGEICEETLNRYL
ncbi:MULTISPECIES: competence type IV pilus ATPase ComGA [Staphylococcus]|uniref:Competence protein ComGA n=2 Tax=Staphylococcus cohnii TaxID=29382 RepID=A0A2T4LQ09_9STAP|nr:MULTISPECIES: competence type IV pilus ATPase ComGA [Staphylococcus]MCE5035103.1 Flp pilus assembly complex ATPase component TadA [Staphylococcus cohnii]MCE5098809.1 Flp pilus assembly complex ATPase component TadA [Staphylococcus cohnii]MSU28857.1 type II/IV secretion system protein [Staphylococcus sp. McC-251-APC-3A2]PTE76436.1 competence protein ComGA [Staphylococcus cohnii]PTF17349.1 competence protein ComGA [Staphylococcus cohnii]